MKQIIKRGIVFLLAVVMMTCQSSILSLAEEERETTENTDNEEKEQKETEDTKEMVSAPSALLMEVSTGKVLYEKNADEKRPPASVTKIMTLLLVFDALDAGVNTDESVHTARSSSACFPVFQCTLSAA